MQDKRPIEIGEARSRLAQSQRDVLLALGSRGEIPASFDPSKIRLAGRSLQAKRLRALFRRWPFFRTLGTEVTEYFRGFAVEHRILESDAALADGPRFARWLIRRSAFPDKAKELKTIADFHSLRAKLGRIRARVLGRNIYRGLRD